MTPLDLDKLNARSPYVVWRQKGELRFKTDYEIVYSVDFEREYSYTDSNAFWFNLYNRSAKKSPNDIKLQKTIVCIIEEFFRSNPDILLYICDTADSQQAVRARLFLRWFNAYNKNTLYVIRTALVIDEGEANYISLIIQRTHPLFNAVIKRFDQEIAMFQGEK